MIFNPPLTSFDTLSDSFAKQLIVPGPALSALHTHDPTSAAGRAAFTGPGVGTPDCVDLPITVMNRVLLLRPRPEHAAL